MLIRILLHTGSQHMFITSVFAQQLQCPFLHTKQVIVFTFGNTRNPLQYDCRLVQLTLRSWYSGTKITLQALEESELCTVTTPPVDQRITEQLRHNHLQAANLTVPTEGGKVHVLISSNAYWKVVTGDIHHLDENLTARSTIFGWVIHGVYASGLYSNVTPVLFLNCNHPDTPSIPLEASEMWRLEAIVIYDSGPCTDASHMTIERFTSQALMP